MANSHLGFIALLACLPFKYVNVRLSDTLLMRPQPLVRARRVSTAVTTCTAFLTAGFVTMTTTARTILMRETVVSERIEETAERKGYQKTDGERKRTVALATMFNIIILSFYYRLILSG